MIGLFLMERSENYFNVFPNLRRGESLVGEPLKTQVPLPQPRCVGLFINLSLIFMNEFFFLRSQLKRFLKNRFARLWRSEKWEISHISSPWRTKKTKKYCFFNKKSWGNAFFCLFFCITLLTLPNIFVIIYIIAGAQCSLWR